MQNTQTSHQVFHAFDMNPDVKFEIQADQETIILLLRAHPVTQITWILNTIILIIILVSLNLFLPIFLSFRQIIVLNIFGAVGIFSYAWFNFLSWFFNVGLITTERIVDIDFHGVIYKEVTATTLPKVEDVTSKSGGYFKSLFNYGDVYIQTAGTEENIEFLSVPRPSQVVQIINNLLPR